MSYQVLARKWRPRTFRELVGQEHVVRALVNALNNDRLHHAFLFTGTRGVGKTTIARILAKSLNCEQGVTATPCGVCSACREIDEGRYVDLIEVDAASRTGVDDTRDLLENVPYAPARGRYKVYLIDEVHMFSKSSFNALLKTLEEPPPHVKFLLATTDPQRVPVTILSRCLQFSLKSLPATLIAKHLDTLLEREGIAREAPAVALIAQAGNGSMRDALSLLDQAIAFGGGRLGANDVGAMLGTLDQGQVLKLLDALAVGDAAAAMTVVAELDQAAPDYAAVLADLLSALHRIALAQLVPEAPLDDALEADTLRRLADTMTPEDVQLFYQIALLGRRDLPLAPDPRGGFEMILLRMLCFRPAEDGASVPAENAADRHPDPLAAPSARPPAPQPMEVPREASTEWSTLVDRLGLSGVARQLALNCVLEKRDGEHVHLLLAPACAQTRTANAEERLRAALADYLGEPLRLHIRIGEPGAPTPAEQHAQRQAERQQATAATIQDDPNVRALCDRFDARVQPDSITPIE